MKPDRGGKMTPANGPEIKTLRAPARFGQSPSVAWMSASAATAAVSARRMRGPRLRRITRGPARIAARSSSSKPPSGPIKRPTPPSARAPRERVERARLFRLLVAEDEESIRRPMPERLFERLGRDLRRPDHAALLAGLDRVRAQTLQVDARDLGVPGDERPQVAARPSRSPSAPYSRDVRA